MQGLELIASGAQADKTDASWLTGPLIDAVDHAVVGNRLDVAITIGLEQLVHGTQSDLGDSTRIQGSTLGSRASTARDLVTRFHVFEDLDFRDNVKVGYRSRSRTSCLLSGTKASLWDLGKFSG